MVHKIRGRNLLPYLLFLFVIFSVAGWSVEVAFRSGCSRELVIPGFLTGPYCPIYGFGMASVLLLCNHKNKWISFWRIMVLCSGLEYMVSYFFEMTCHRLLWDYSGLPFSVGSRVCLLFSLVWGFFGVVMLREVEPHLHRFYIRHRRTADALAEAVLLVIILDTAIKIV